MRLEGRSGTRRPVRAMILTILFSVLALVLFACGKSNPQAVRESCWKNEGESVAVSLGFGDNGSADFHFVTVGGESVRFVGDCVLTAATLSITDNSPDGDNSGEVLSGTYTIDDGKLELTVGSATFTLYACTAEQADAYISGFAK